MNIYKMTFKERILPSVPQGGTNHHHASFRAKYQKSETISEVTQKTALERTFQPVPRRRVAGRRLHGGESELRLAPRLTGAGVPARRCVPVGDK